MQIIKPSSQQESEEIWSLLKTNGIKSYGAWFSKTTNGPSEHKYADGSTLLYNGWRAGQPDAEDLIACGYLSADNGMWYDTSGCNRPYEVTVCQRVSGNNIMFAENLIKLK